MANNATDTALPTRPSFLSILRIVLGLILISKSIYFIMDIARLELLLQSDRINFLGSNTKLLSFIIAYPGLLCGIFITIGLATRLMSLLQIPVLLGAVFFVNYNRIDQSSQEFIISLITLLLLILFLIKGSMEFSADAYFKRGKEMDRRGEHD